RFLQGPRLRAHRRAAHEDLRHSVPSDFTTQSLHKEPGRWHTARRRPLTLHENKRMTRLSLITGCCAAVAAVAVNAQAPRPSPVTSPRASQFADSILRLMTLEEKIGQL